MIDYVLTLESKTIPSNHRTIFINHDKFKLKFPELTFFYKDKSLFVLIMKGKPHYVPLPNIAYNGCVCLGTTTIKTIDDGIDSFFNSEFMCYASKSYFLESISLYAIRKYVFKYKTLPRNLSKYDGIEEWIVKQNVIQYYLDNLIPCD